MRRVRRTSCAAVCVLFVVAGVASPSAQDSGRLPELTQPVTDLANVIDPDSERQIDALSRTLQAASGDVVVVVTLPTIAPFPDLRTYAVELFENHGRGIGQTGEDNGVLIVLAVAERSVWIEVGYGLEQWITDGFAGETSREMMIPEFRQERYGPGLLNGTARVISRIAERRDVTLEGVEIPRTAIERDSRISPTVVVFIIVALIVLSSLDGGGGRRGRRNVWTSGVGPFGGGWMYGSGGWGRRGGFGGGVGGGFGGGFGGFGGGRSGGGGGGGSW